MWLLGCLKKMMSFSVKGIRKNIKFYLLNLMDNEIKLELLLIYLFIRIYKNYYLYEKLSSYLWLIYINFKLIY